MQKVSKAYRESMKSSLRERAYIKLSFGLVNQEAQEKARIEEEGLTPYSNVSSLFGKKTDDTVYATLEENFTTVDGRMFFLPRGDVIGGHYDTGLVSENLISDGEFALTINLNMLPTDFRGITINFGENYPVDFDIVSDQGQRAEFRGNDQSEFTTEEVFSNTSTLTLVFYTMKNPQSRLRIYSIRFGYGLVYYNDSVVNSSLESYVSPIGADIPQVDFTVTLTNYDRYFNVDNPRSAIHFLETGQEMDIYYGYQLPGGGVEWIQGNHLLCSEWESDDHTATIRCQDVFRNMDTEYYRGMYTATGKSYYTLALEILTMMGITEHRIDRRLMNLYTKNPLPRVKCKEALQIIANACRCTLTQSRTGLVEIKSNFSPLAKGSPNGEITEGDDVVDETIYTVRDEGGFFQPRSEEDVNRNGGFITIAQSNAKGNFGVKPVITIKPEVTCVFSGIHLTFGDTLPSNFVVKTYNAGTLLEAEVWDTGITKDMFIPGLFSDFDRMDIEFAGTDKPSSTLTVDQVTFTDVTHYNMTKRDMTASPKSIKQEVVKEVIVPCYNYQTGNPEESLISEDVIVTAGEEMTFFMGAPSYGYRATLDEAAENVTIVESGDYFVTVRFAEEGAFRFEVWGYRYKVVERYATVKLRERGKTIKWENPLISDMTMANDLAEWIAEYYSSGVEYEYTTRGNPEIDTNDMVYQENEFRDNMKVTIYRATLNFAQTFSGKITARRVEV